MIILFFVFLQFASSRFLTEREKKLRLRRKAAEELIAWKKKLDDEELQVREIEKKAHQVLAKVPTSTIASSGGAVKSPTTATSANKSKQQSPADGANEDQQIKSEQKYEPNLDACLAAMMMMGDVRELIFLVIF